MNELLRKLLFLPPQASTVAGDIDRLHYFIILVTMGGAALVTLVGGYFLIRYRRTAVARNPVRRKRPQIPLWLEFGVVGSLFGLFLLWWIIGFWQYMRVRVPPEGTMDIYVTGKQWMWKFAYPDGANSLAALYVPTGRPVKLILTSRDVIHSFYVPDFRVKQDAVPGRLTTLWFEVKEPGRHEILCTEYCGAGHSTMRGEVIALSPEDYDRWLRGQAPEPPVAGPLYTPPAVAGQDVPAQPVSMVRQGERVAAEQGCLRCHTLDGTAHLGPTWAGMFGSTVPLERGGSVVVDEAYITESMMDPLAKLHAGYQPIMPTYFGRIRPADTAAIVELIKSLRAVPVQPGGRAPWATVTTPQGAVGATPAQSVTPEGAAAAIPAHEADGGPAAPAGEMGDAGTGEQRP